MNRRTFALIGLLLCSTAYSAGTSIWNATDRGTVAATDRLPVATSSSSGPLYVTPLTLQSYLLSGSATTEVLANNAGAFDGDSGFTFNATNNSVDLGGATLTASDPVLDLSQTWNNAGVTFTGLKLNVTDTTSAAGSLLADFQVGGSSKASIAKSGTVDANGASIGGNSLALAGGFAVSDADIEIGAIISYGLSSIGLTGYGISLIDSGTSSTGIVSDAYDTFAVRNGANASTLRVYDTYTDASNYGRIALNTSLTGDWVQVAAETAGTGADNYNIALTPRGTGAISAHVPDSTAAGGNARGANSVDWQTTRSAATHVASGAASVISGGSGNVASGANSVVSGGYANNAGGGNSTISGGFANSTAGQYSTVPGGFGNTVSGQFANAIGRTNTASGESSTVGGGSGNTASGIYSWIPGGFSANTRSLLGAYAYSAGARSVNGDAQIIGQPVRRTTSDATPVSLATDGTPAATTVMVLPASSTLMCDAMVVAQSGAGTDNAGYKISAVIQRDASNNTALVGTATTTTVAEDTAGMDATIVANDTLESAQIQVTGVAATTIYWVGELKCVQVL